MLVLLLHRFVICSAVSSKWKSHGQRMPIKEELFSLTDVRCPFDFNLFEALLLVAVCVVNNWSWILTNRVLFSLQVQMDSTLLVADSHV